MFSAIFSSPRCKYPTSGVAFVMISPSNSKTMRNTPCVAGCDGPMFKIIFSPATSPCSSDCGEGRWTGADAAILRKLVNPILHALAWVAVIAVPVALLLKNFKPAYSQNGKLLMEFAESAAIPQAAVSQNVGEQAVHVFG